jgi:hypothetical protein
MNLTPAQQQHYTNVGYLLLNHALSEVTPILSRLGHPSLATVPAAGIALPFGNTAPSSPSAVLTGIAALNAKIGKINTRGGQRDFRCAVTSLPTVDGFGRPFPSLDDILGMSQANARKHFTNSGWPKVVVAGITFYMNDSATEGSGADSNTLYGGTIKAGDWRAWNGVPGKAARYFLPQHVAQHLALSGMTAEAVKATLAKDGISIAEPQAVTSPEPSKAKGKGKGSKAETKA